MSAPPLREPKKPGRTCKLCIVEERLPKLQFWIRICKKTGRTCVSISPLLKKILPHRLLKLLLPTSTKPSKPLKTFNLTEQQILQRWGAPPTYRLPGAESTYNIICKLQQDHEPTDEMQQW